MYSNISNSSRRRALLLGAASIATLGLNGTAYAQDTSVETVVVTGSRIPTTNLTTTSPVTELSSGDISTTGVTRVEDLVTQLPQAFAAQNSSVSNGASGTATVDLRGLGEDRTLVLIDGQRMPYGSPKDAAADLNEIPTLMVERVEVLTGGASAVYGSDAVAGVVNFIMKKDFEGFQIDAQYDTYQHDNGYDGIGNIRNLIQTRAANNPSQFALPPNSVMDGAGVEVSALMGINSGNGKGNLTTYFSYRKDQPIIQKNRDYSACSIGYPTDDNGNAIVSKFTCGGSSTSYPGLFTNFSAPGEAPYYWTLGPTHGTFQPWGSQYQYNYGAANYYQRPDTRYSLGSMGHYNVNSHVEIYTQLMFTDYQTVAQVAPSGDFFNSGPIGCGTALLSPSQAAAINCTPAMIAANTPSSLYVGRRNVEGGPRQDNLEYTSYRAVVGLRGEITKGWNYDVSGQYSKVVYAENYLNDVSKTRLTNALNVVSQNGNLVCESVVNGTDPNCVPYDIFSGNGPSKAALNYLSVPLLTKGYTDLQDMTASVNGDLGAYGIRSPWAKGGVQVAMGIEYRSNDLSLLPDLEFQTGDGAGQGGPTMPVSGRTNVTEGFAELKMPVIENMPFAELVSLDAAYRYSSYNLGSVTNTWKIGGDWQTTDDMRFRASYSKAIRAANVIDLYTPQGFALFDMAQGDPCGAASVGTAWHASLAQCVATGVPASVYGSKALDNSAGQYNYMQSGNANLTPEQANTYSAGVVLTPTFLPGFSGSVDYYHIAVTNEIQTNGDVLALSVLTACYQENVASQCALIHRNGSGNLWTGTGYIAGANTNLGSMRTSGVDMNAAYQLDLHDVGADGYGSLLFTYVGTWMQSFIYNWGIQGVAPFDCAGHFASYCGTPDPRYRHRLRMTWTMPWDSIDVSATWRHYSAVTQFGADASYIDYRLAGQNYLDLETSIPLPNNTTLRFGVNNVLDSDPPITAQAGTTGNGNTFPQLYDAYGRYLFAGITINL